MFLFPHRNYFLKINQHYCLLKDISLTACGLKHTVHLKGKMFNSLLKCHNLSLKIEILRNKGCSSSSCVFSQVPMFVQTQQKWRRMYAGECQGPGVRTDFEMVHLRKVPSQYNHLSGLLDIFKSKIVSSLSKTHQREKTTGPNSFTCRGQRVSDITVPPSARLCASSL